MYMYMCSCQLHNLSTEYTALLPLPLLSTLNNSRNLLHLQKFWLHQKFPITAKDKDFWPFDPIRTVSVISQLPDFFGSWNSSSSFVLLELFWHVPPRSQKPFHPTICFKYWQRKIIWANQPLVCFIFLHTAPLHGPPFPPLLSVAAHSSGTATRFSSGLWAFIFTHSLCVTVHQLYLPTF